MALRDFTSQRLFFDTDLGAGRVLACDGSQANYLVNVLRMKLGDALLVFNGRDGEWRGRITAIAKRGCELTLEEQTRAQTGGPDIDFVFALLKRTKVELVAQKATELGVSRILPVVSDHTQVDRINAERMRANIIEAAEQCGVLRVPVLAGLGKLSDVIAAWPADRLLVFCDEAADVADPVAALQACKQTGGAAQKLGVVIGPEGGFSQAERAQLLDCGQVVRVSLGPRIMRADTAGIAALTLVQATLGDWVW